jgi:hypothetical protein
MAALTHAFSQAVLDAVRSASMRELAELLELESPSGRGHVTDASSPSWEDEPTLPAPAPPSRSARGRTSPPPRRRMRPLESLPPPPDAYADVTIVDPEAVLAPRDESLSATPAAEDGPRAPIASPNDVGADPAPERAPDPKVGPGEEILRSSGGGVVLRRRGPPAPSGAQGGEAP